MVSQNISLIMIPCFRYNNKLLDLSNPIRLSGLTPNAKLELVQLSKSASIVSVALQLPESETQGVPNNRLTDKFPSDTSLWLVLRKFESGVAGGLGIKKNFTARGVPAFADGDKGEGRLYHEMPVLQYLSNQMSTFEDLQKTLGKLGFNGGSILLRLSFRATQAPLEEAMQDIDAYFKSVEAEDSHTRGAHAGSLATAESVPDPSPPALAETDAGSHSPPDPNSTPPLVTATDPVTTPARDTISSTTSSNREDHQGEASTIPSPAPSSEPTVTGPNQRPVSIYAAPSSTTPRAAQQAHNENDYIPTIQQAKRHQSHLASNTLNQRLASYAEDEKQQKAKTQRLAETKELIIKLRFPDQTIAEAQFTDLDTVATLYDCVRGLLKHEDAPFLLNYRSPKPQEIPKFTNSKDSKRTPQENTQHLIRDVGLVGKLMINVIWEDGASLEAREHPVLKPEYVKNAKEIEIPNIQGQGVEEDIPAPNKPQSNVRAGGGDKKGMPAWMRKTIGKK